uniref:tRNA (uracil-O(2)-)-methyltransferase n=1 Tax=Ditylenchus dipsaci TaxID=166011 RepID=A0A915DEA7_9BILA
MAARLKCNFFLLPCCAYDFFSKFSRTSRKEITGVGVPDTYHNFIKSIIQKLGFDLKEDQLKIPSRKTKCFIGTIPGNGLPENVEEIIEELLLVARQVKPTFFARPAIQQLRNCSAIPHDFRLATTRKFFEYLLALEDTENKDSHNWRSGSSVPLIELANLLSDQEKNMMKNQDGGMQTFLKNQHQVFLTRSGRVEIRNWPVVYKEFLQKPNIKDNFQKSPCWFYFNHPDGCPVNDSHLREFL